MSRFLFVFGLLAVFFFFFFFIRTRPPPKSPLFPSPPLFRSEPEAAQLELPSQGHGLRGPRGHIRPGSRRIPPLRRMRADQRVQRLARGSHCHGGAGVGERSLDRKSTRLNSSHSPISYAVLCL